MAEKILSIKLNLDTTEGAKFATLEKVMVDSIETVRIKQKEANDAQEAFETSQKGKAQERLDLIAKQAAAYVRLQNTVLNAQNAISEGSKTANQLAGTLANSFNAYNKVIDVTKEKLIALNNEYKQMSLAAANKSMFVGGESVGTGTGRGNGLAGSDAAAKARLEREESFRQNFNAATAAMDLQAATQREEAVRAAAAKAMRIQEVLNLAIHEAEVKAAAVHAEMLDQQLHYDQANYNLRLIQAGEFAARVLEQERENARVLGVARNIARNISQNQTRETENERVRQAGIAAAAREEHTIRMSSFDNTMRTQEERFRSSMSIRNAEEIHGIDSVQAARARVDAHNDALESRRRASLASIRTQVSAGTITPIEGLAQAARATDEYTAALQRNIAATGRAATQHQGLLVRIAEVMGAYKLLNISLQYVKQALIDIPTAGLEQQVTESSLLGIFGSEKTASNLAFIKDVANEAGQSLIVLEQAYRRYAPSAILAGANQEAVNKSFKEFAEVGTILHLPEEKINSLFLALDQMFAKGVVQSEEVKKQLGNVLPGAVEAFASSLGKTPAAFMDSMKANQVIAKDAIPKFAEYYRKIFGGPDDSVFNLTKDRLQSNLYRLQSSYTLMDRAIFEDTKETMNNIVKVSANMVTSITANIKGIIQAVEVLSAVILTRLATVAITAAITSFQTLATTASRALLMITGLAAPELAIAAAVAYTTTKVIGLGLAYDKASGFLVTYKDKQYGLINFLTSSFDKAIDDSTYYVNKFTSALDALGVKTSWITAIIDSLKMALPKLSDFGFMEKTFDDVGIRAAIKDQEDLIKSYQDTKKTKADLDADTKAGKFNAIVSPTSGLTSMEKDKITKDNIERVNLINKLATIPEAEHATITEEETGLTSAAANKALQKEQAILKQQTEIIKVEGAKKVAELEKLKAATSQAMLPAAGGKVDISQESGIKKIGEIDIQLKKIQEGIEIATLRATMASEKEIVALEKKALLITKNRDLLYDAVRWQETKVRSDTDISSGAKGTFSGRGASAVSGSEADKSRGAMQITESAWKDTGRKAADFTTATMEQLAQAGRDYLDLMIKRFKDVEIALAAYNQGTGTVEKLYKKAGIKEGSTDAEDLSKVKAGFTPKMQSYVSSTLSGVSPDKGNLAQIDLVTKEIELQGKLDVAKIQTQAMEAKAHSDNVAYQEQSRVKALSLHSEALGFSGKIAEAEKIKLNLEMQSLRQQFAGNTEALKDLDIIQKGKQGRAELTVLETKLKDITGEVANREASINIARQNGLMTYKDAASQLVAEKQKVYDIEIAIEAELEKQIAAGINLTDNAEKLANIKAAQQRKVDAGAALQNRVISSGGSGLVSSVAGNLKDQADIKANKESELANFKADPTKTAQENQDKKSAITDKANKAELSSNLQMYSSIADAGAQTFSTITSSMIKMYGARSTQARAAFAMEKAMRISSTIMHTATDVMSAMELPPPMDGIMAGIVAAMGAVQLATIMAQPMPQAHAGLTDVPADQTYLLSKGERVLAPQQNKDLTHALANGGLGNTSNKVAPPQVNVRVNNILDPSVIGDYMSTPIGEQMVVNIMRRNQ